MEEKKLTIVVATNNEHKLKELRELFSPYKVNLLSLRQSNIHVDPVEDGNSYKENAFIKANEIAKFTSYPVLSDDSGIEIEALGEHFPGIYSHRYTEANGGQKKVNEFLVKNHHGSKATFYCHMVLLNLEPGKRFDFEGTMEGKINSKVEGEYGFGYDPIFVPNGFEHSVSTLSDDEKNKISHRHNAAVKVIDFLKQISKI